MSRIRTAALAALVPAFLLGGGLAAYAALAKIVLPPTVTPVLTTGTTILGQPIAYPDGVPLVVSSIVTLPPGGATGWHSHGVPLFGYVLEGTLTVDYGDRGQRTYNTGAGFMEAMDWPHNGMNLTSAPVRILTFYAGAEGVDMSTPAAVTDPTSSTR